MADDTVHLALFKEDQIDHATEAIEKLRQLGIGDKDMSIISGIPYSEKVLGRPIGWTRIVQVALGGAVVGFLVAMFLTFGTVFWYPQKVGGQPIYAIPTSIVVIFEITMLGLLISTFIGVFIETITPSFGPKGYSPKVSDGHIGIVFTCPPDLDSSMHAALKELGAELVHNTEVKQ
jgi:hypothetical protein